MESAYALEQLLSDAAWVRALALRLVEGEDRAEELAQETWLAALRKPPARGQPLRPWLATVARNLARTRWRDDARRVEREQRAARAEALTSTDALVERAELERTLVGLVLGLEEPFRSTLLLRFYEGLEPREIAALQQVPVATVRTRCFRGVEKLRAELDARAPGGRERWMAAFAPLALRGEAAAALGGALWMKGLAWSACALAAVALVAALAGSSWRGEGPGPEGGVELASTPREREPEARAELESARAPEPPATRAPAAASEQDAGAGRFTLVLVDAATGAPVPGYRATLRAADGASEALESDALGRVRPGFDAARGPFELELAEERRPGDAIQHRRVEAQAAPRAVSCAPAAGEALELAIPAGPTFRFAVAWPGGLDAADFRALLWPADATDRFDRLHAEVRSGALPWARFSALARLMKPGPPYELRLTSRDGLWTGAALVEDLDRAESVPVRVDFEPRAALSGVVLDRDGAPAARSFVQLWAPGASFASQENRPLLTTTDAEGRYRLSAVPPGPYTLKLERDHHVPVELELVLEAGLVRTLDLRLEGDGPLPHGELRGVVTSASGRFDGPLSAFARARTEPPAIESAEVEWREEGGVLVGRFAIPGLREGEHRLSLSGEDFHALEPAEQLVAPSEHEHAFRVLDEGELRALAVTVVDEASGALVPFPRVTLTLEREDGERTTRDRTPPDGRARFGGLPPRPVLGGTVTAEGYRTLWLEPRRYDLDAQPALELALRRGWARDLLVLDPDDRPLGGAAVFADGALVGETDARGHLRLSLDARPRALSVELDGWRPHPRSRLDPDTGAFRDSTTELRVVLQR